MAELNPSVMCIQESKQKQMGKIKIQAKDHTVFELVRKDSNGGGLATIIKSDLNPVWIGEGDDKVELLIVEIHIENLPIRIINGYGPQETDSIERKNMFWSRLSREVNEALELDIGIIIQMDGNLHCGPETIKDDPNPINNNGKLFVKFLEDNPSLVLLNNSDKCEGLITRSRVKGSKIERAVLDFVLVSDSIEPFVVRMKIDEDREYPLTSYLKSKQIHSDHFTEVIDFDIKFKRQRPERYEVFDFKNVESQEKFKNILNNENNLSKCFDNDENLEQQVENWFSELNKVFNRSFKKIRQNGKIKETESSKLQKKRSK